MCFRKEESGKRILYLRFCLSYVRKAYQFLFDVWEGKEESERLRFVKTKECAECTPPTFCR